MPELPEVETVTNGIQSLVNQTIINSIIRQPKLRYHVDSNLNNYIFNTKIKQITRRAKYIIMHLSNDYFLIWHLGMSGSITIADSQLDSLKKHDHIDIIFNNDKILRYNDPRRFGCLIITKDPKSHPLLKNLGPEPLSNEFNQQYLYQKLVNKKLTIKQLIMDNKIVVGVGNIYACESLFKAQISPLRSGLSITEGEAQLLTSCIKNTLKEAIKNGGSSLRDYKQADGKLGYFQNSHQVYNKANKPCGSCNTIILEKRIGQRNTFYCPRCQK